MQRNLESGQYLPGWMNYYDDKNMLIGIPNKVGLYTITVKGKAEIIKEQFKLNVIENHRNSSSFASALGSDDEKGGEDEEREASIELQKPKIAIMPSIHDEDRELDEAVQGDAYERVRET